MLELEVGAEQVLNRGSLGVGTGNEPFEILVL